MRVISATGKARGLTLLELMVVLAILALLATAWPLSAAHLMPAQMLRVEINELSGTLRTTRSSAISNNQIIELDVINGGHAYAVNNSIHSLPNEVILSLQDYQQQTINRIVFYPDGSSNGVVAQLARGSHRAQLSVGRLTGRVEML